MGNYCSGCCQSPPQTHSPTPQTHSLQTEAHFPAGSPSGTRSPTSQDQFPPPQPHFPAESPAETQSPTPQLPSQSQVEVVDLKQLYASIKDSTELDRLISHVKHLLSVIEKAQSPQDVKKDSSKGFVKDMIERAAKFLETISTQGAALKNDGWALNRTGGMQTVISSALKGVGEFHWIAVGLSAIAYVMDSIQQATSNFNQCVHLLRKLVDIGERLPALRRRMASHEAEHLNEAVHAIVGGVISCCCCMSERKIFRYLFSSADKANLQDRKAVIDDLYTSLIFMVAMDIQGQIPRRYYPSEPQPPFGAVAEIIRLLDMQSKGRSQAVILYGFGGAGKTTLGDCVVSKLKSDLNLGGIKYSRIQLGDKQLNEVQQDLYAELTNKELRFKNLKDGQEKLKEVLEKETAFIFIDNALTKDQINDLLPSQLSLPHGSRLLLTSRNLNVVEELQSRNIVCTECLVDGLPEEAANEYFRKAVIQNKQLILALDRREISLDKVDAVAKACHGVPLLLRVYAQHLARRGSDPRVYDEMLDGLRKGEFHSDNENRISERFLYVCHKLSQDDKDAFVDICTYFHGWGEEDVSYIVSRTVLDDLIDRALVKIDESQNVMVHDILEALGIKEGKGTRIQDVRDLKKSQEMKGIWLFNSERLFTLESEILIRMKDHLRVIALGSNIRLSSECDLLLFSKLRFLQIEDLHGLPSFCSELPRDLRYLRIKTREFPESLSSSKLSQRILMNLKSLGDLQKFAFECLEMKMFPNNFQLPASLRELDLSNCDDLQELPAELCSLTGLSKLKLDGCSRLKSLPKEFYNLSGLTYLSMNDCAGLQALPKDFGQLTSLEILNLSGCFHLETLGADFGGLSSLDLLNISNLGNVAGFPESFGDLRKLRDLTIQSCRSLRSLPDRFGDLSTLQSLGLSGCGGLTCLPDRFGDLSTLQSLDLSWCEGLTCLPDRFGDLSTLQSLHLSGCGGLTCLPDRFGDLSTLQSLHLSSYGGLTCLLDRFGDLSTLQSLHLSGCGGLTCLPDRFGELRTLQTLDLSG